MKKKALTLIAVLFIFNTIAAQSFAWARSMGNNGDDKGNAVALDPNGNVITVGNFSNTADFDPSSSGTHNMSPLPGGQGMFVSKLSPAGNYIWAVSFDCTGNYNPINAVKSDGNGNVYVVGDFGGVADFDPSPSGTFTLASSGPSDMFVCKLDAAGNFIWAFQLGGTGSGEECTSVALDASGNVYITGSFFGTTDFDPSPSATASLSPTGVYDAFICKYTSAGNLVWTKRLGGTSGTWSNRITVDASQNVYTTGYFMQTTDLDPSPSATAGFTSSGQSDMYVSKLDVSGNFVWAKQICGSQGEFPQGVVVDGSSNVYLCGGFTGTADFDPSTATHTLINYGNGLNAFVLKLDASGGFVWANSFPPSNLSYVSAASAIDVSTQGNIYITGGFSGDIDFDPSPATYTLISNSSCAVFITKLNNNGNLTWAKKIAASCSDEGLGLIVDPAENVFVTGSFYGTNSDFDPSPTTTYNLSSFPGTGNDIFILKLASNAATVGLSNTNPINVLASTYPNPTTGIFTLKTDVHENVIAVIYSIMGHKIKTVALSASSTLINLSDLNEGVYNMELIRNGTAFYRFKLVKTNNQ
jgi:hypothetical protein